MKYAAHVVSSLVCIIAVLLYFLAFPSQSPFASLFCSSCEGVQLHSSGGSRGQPKPQIYSLPKLPYAYDVSTKIVEYFAILDFFRFPESEASVINS